MIYLCNSRLCLGDVEQCCENIHYLFSFWQRKPEDEPEEDEAAKKARQDSGKKEPAKDEKAGGDGPTTNGTDKPVNGTTGVNGTNGVSPEKKEVHGLPVTLS